MSIDSPKVKFPPIRRSEVLLGTGLLALALFTCLPDSYGLMVEWPWVMLWQMGFLAIAVWSVWQLRLFQQPFRLLGAQLDWSMGLSLISLIGSTLFAYRPQPSVWYLAMAAGYGMTLYALVNWLGGDGKDQPSLNGVLSSAQRRWWLLNGLGAWALLASGLSLVLAWVNRSRLLELVNPFPLGHHNFVAGYLVLVLPVLFVLAISQRGWQRGIWLMGVVMAIASLYTTGSRGGVLGFLCLLAVLVTVLVTQTVRKRWQLAAIGSLTLAVFAGFFLTNTRVQRLLAAVLTGQVEGNAQFRLFTMQAGLGLWQSHPWFGVGPGNTIKLYDIYRPIEAGDLAFRVQQVHSTPIQLLAELGLVGGLAYLAWLGLLVRLVWQLWRTTHPQPQSNPDRWMLYGCSAGLLAYGVSSLSDFQLENIGISLTIVVLIAVLVSLGHDRSLPPSLQVPRLRRYLSLLGFTLILGAVRVWLPVDLSMMLAKAGSGNLQTGDVPNFYHNWSTAAKITPWDPYYEFQLGAQLAELLDAYHDAPLLEELLPQNLPAKDIKAQTQLLNLARQHLKRSVELVPADELFNRYLGALLLDLEPEQAVKLLRQAVQLTPRKTFSYAQLGTAYLKQNDLPNAVNAFALEGFINPAFLTTDVWIQPMLVDSWLLTVQKSVQLYTQCLEQLQPDQPGYEVLYQNKVLLQWWIRTANPQGGRAIQPAPTNLEVELQRLSPIAQALLLIDQGKLEQALALLQKDPVSSTTAQPAELLKAWIAPERYLAQLEKTYPDAIAGVPGALSRTIQQNRQIRQWLLSIQSSTKMSSGRLSFFTYRNMNGLDAVELPRLLPINLLVQELRLFQRPGFLPVFDQVLVAAQKSLLNLDRPKLPS